jgi:hypothetical protein
LLDLRESTNFQEERQKPNYKCWKWNNKWKQNKFLNLSNKSKLKKLPKKNLNKYSVLNMLQLPSQPKNLLRPRKQSSQLLIKNLLNKKKPKKKLKRKLKRKKRLSKQNNSLWNKNKSKKKNKSNRCWCNNNNKNKPRNKRKLSWPKNLSKKWTSSAFLSTKSISSKLLKRKMK